MISKNKRTLKCDKRKNVLKTNSSKTENKKC